MFFKYITSFLVLPVFCVLFISSGSPAFAVDPYTIRMEASEKAKTIVELIEKDIKTVSFKTTTTLLDGRILKAGRFFWRAPDQYREFQSYSDNSGGSTSEFVLKDKKLVRSGQGYYPMDIYALAVYFVLADKSPLFSVVIEKDCALETIDQRPAYKIPLMLDRDLMTFYFDVETMMIVQIDVFRSTPDGWKLHGIARFGNGIKISDTLIIGSEIHMQMFMPHGGPIEMKCIVSDLLLNADIGNASFNKEL